MNESRYSRQTMIPCFGVDSQEKLKQSSIALVGVGGVGGPAALYLAAAGVGKITLIDNDHVDLHNLQRQILYDMSQIGELKIPLVEEKLAKLNNDITVIAHPVRLNKSNAAEMLSQHTLVLDGSDNFETRFIIDDACVSLNQPFISVSVDRFYGKYSLLNYQGSPTYRDIYPHIEVNYPFAKPSQRGVLGTVPGMLAMIAVTEALKLMGQFAIPYVGEIIYDAWDMSLTKFEYAQRRCSESSL
jgi:adenylyltransferase/sulfurtransferase